MTKPEGEYVVTFSVPVYAYVEFDEDGEATVTKVVVDDENISAPERVERMGKDLVVVDEVSEEATEVMKVVDGDVEWPGWEFGF